LTRFAGRDFEDPIIIASGVVPDVPAYMKRVCKRYRPSAITTKSLTLSPLQPHPPPTFIKLDQGCYLNAIGLGNPGPSFLSGLEVDCPLIVSVAGRESQEIVQLVKEAGSKGVLLELNLSSPNRAGYGQSIASMTYEVVKDAVSVSRVPILVKLGPWDNVVELAGKAISAGASGLTLINTMRGMAVDIESGRPILSYVTGGVSGRCIHSVAVRVIYEVYREYGVEIVGTGGVYTWRDVIEMMMVGAKMVGLGTVLVERGLEAINEIREGLKNYLASKGLKEEEIVGYAVKR
jgi:dihydroorotate dehydrogenase (fumarate)